MKSAGWIETWKSFTMPLMWRLLLSLFFFGGLSVALAQDAPPVIAPVKFVGKIVVIIPPGSDLAYQSSFNFSVISGDPVAGAAKPMLYGTGTGHYAWSEDLHGLVGEVSLPGVPLMEGMLIKIQVSGAGSLSGRAYHFTGFSVPIAVPFPERGILKLDVQTIPFQPEFAKK